MSNAENELKEQLPFYFRPIVEYGEILKVQGHVLDQLEDNMAKVSANNYISSCDEATIAYYERLLGIVYRFGDALDYRRTRVLQKYNTIVPFSIGFLRDKLTELYGKDGYEMEVDSAACKLKIKVTSDRYGAIDLLYDLLWDVVPAHIQILANQQTAYQIDCMQWVTFQEYSYKRFTDIQYMTLPELLMRQELLQKSVYRQFRMNRSEKHGSI